MRRNFAFFVFILSVCCCSARVSADILVYDNFAGGASGIDNAFLSDSDQSVIQSDDFVLLATEIAISASWTGAYAIDNTPPLLDDFTIMFFDDNGSNQPGAMIGSFNVGSSVNRVASGQNLFGFDIYEYTASFSGVGLNGGQTYWLSIANNTAAENDNWYWGVILNDGNSFGSVDGGTNWTTQGHRHDFQIFASVPERGSLGIVAWGMVALMLGKYRKRN